MDAPLTRLEDARDELARRWIARVVEEASLEEIARLPTDRIARELPELISDILRGADETGERASSERRAHERRSAARLAGLRGGKSAEPAELARDVTALQSVIAEALARPVADPHSRAVLATLDRLSRSLGAVLAAAVSDLMDVRSRELEALANTDALTGLYNVRYMQQHLAHLIGVQRRYGHPFAVLVLDIDGLKRINDAFGHSTGDRVLIGVAEAVRGTIRSIDTPVRLGGDEFCVLAPHQTASRARVLGERITDAVGRIDAPDAVPLTVSVGVVSCPQHGSEADRLFDLADEAMYRSKASGARVATGPVEMPEASGNEDGVSSGGR